MTQKQYAIERAFSLLEMAGNWAPCCCQRAAGPPPWPAAWVSRPPRIPPIFGFLSSQGSILWVSPGRRSLLWPRKRWPAGLPFLKPRLRPGARPSVQARPKTLGQPCLRSCKPFGGKTCARHRMGNAQTTGAAAPAAGAHPWLPLECGLAPASGGGRVPWIGESLSSRARCPGTCRASLQHLFLLERAKLGRCRSGHPPT